MGVAQIGKCPVSGPQHRKCWMMPLSQFCGDRSHGYRQIVTPCWLTFTTTESCASPWPIHQLIRHPMRSCILLCFLSGAYTYVLPAARHSGSKLVVRAFVCPFNRVCSVAVHILSIGTSFSWKQMQISSTSPKSTFSHNYMLVISLNYSRPTANAKTLMYISSTKQNCKNNNFQNRFAKPGLPLLRCSPDPNVCHKYRWTEKQVGKSILCWLSSADFFFIIPVCWGKNIYKQFCNKTIKKAFWKAIQACSCLQQTLLCRLYYMQHKYSSK